MGILILKGPSLRIIKGSLSSSNLNEFLISDDYSSNKRSIFQALKKLNNEEGIDSFKVDYNYD